jgi:tetratricopeptide (TPR) repeat protein
MQQSPDELLEKALTHHTAGELAEAEAIYQDILRQAPDDADALHLLGALTAQKGDADAALGLIDRAIAVDPTCADFHNNRGLILFNLGRTDESIAAHREAARLRPEFPEAHNNLGNALLKKGQLAEATAEYRTTIALRPSYANAYSNLGVALQKQRKMEEAIAAYRQAVHYQPNHAEAHSNLGVALRESGRMAEAIEEYRIAIRMDEKCLDAYSNLGAALQDVGRDDEAIAVLEQAVKLSPEYDAAHYNLALALLRKGQYERGWQEYEHRAVALLVRRTFAAPQWDGGETGGKTILVFAEGGFGDVIQFARYVPMVKKRGGRVVFQVRSELIRLLSQLGADEMIPKDRQAPAFDVHCPLLSLAGIFKTRLDDIPASRYLSADPAIAGQWASKLGEKKNVRIGVTWRGDPVHKNDANRSLDPALLLPLGDVSGITLVNLQARDGNAKSTVPPPELRMVDFTRDISDFAETAGLIEHLDLVISVDTAVAHLAGAMGKKVWLLLPHVADWRWLKDRSDSPWYPTMRIFRQRAAGDWKPVMAEVIRNLSAATEEK